MPLGLGTRAPTAKYYAEGVPCPCDRANIPKGVRRRLPWPCEDVNVSFAQMVVTWIIEAVSAWMMYCLAGEDIFDDDEGWWVAYDLGTRHKAIMFSILWAMIRSPIELFGRILLIPRLGLFLGDLVPATVACVGSLLFSWEYLFSEDLHGFKGVVHMAEHDHIFFVWAVTAGVGHLNVLRILFYSLLAWVRLLTGRLTDLEKAYWDITTLEQAEAKWRAKSS